MSRTPAALDLHPELQAEAAVEMLLARLSGRDADAPCYVEATLQIRASSGGWQKALDRALRVRVGWVPKRFGIGGWSGVGRPPETA